MSKFGQIFEKLYICLFRILGSPILFRQLDCTCKIILPNNVTYVEFCLYGPLTSPILFKIAPRPHPYCFQTQWISLTI